MADPKELRERLKVLSDVYAEQLPEKLRQIKLTWGHISYALWDEEGFQKLRHLVHGLTGSGKTFGFELLSDVARKFEQYLQQLEQAKEILNEEQRNHVHELISELYQVASSRDVTAGDRDIIAVAVSGEHPPLARRIFVVEDDPEFAEEMKIHLSYFGYEVSVFHTLKDFRSALQETSRVVVLMDVNFPEDNLGGIHAMHEIQQGRDTPIPVIFLSAHNELEVRLDAVRAGGVAYLNKPPNIGNLIDKLDELTSLKSPIPYRVLIVDDSTTLTTYYTAVLEHAGMKVRAVNDPLKTMEPLLDFSPDLILIDLYMPGCNGMDLAMAIRQIEAFVSIPIVFLSAESNLDKQLFAMGLGGDDFLTKPIQPQHLISSVTSRIRRSLMLRSFMVRDSLTGLLNHTAIKDQLEQEVIRARRQGTPLSFAMIDIDHFKQVNDTYGHPVGDRVIKSLSRLLKQRLRENDIVGRYGGEEFAVILIDTDGDAAARVLDGIRDDFSSLRHLADGKEFSVTFSCGVADVAHFNDPIKMCEASDRQLYQAKHAGRNKVMSATSPDPVT